MRGMVYQIRHVYLNDSELNIKRNELVKHHKWYEIQFWLTIILSTIINTFVWEIVASPPFSSFISIVITLLLFKLPEFLFYIRYLFTGLTISYIDCIYSLWFYPYAAKVVTAIDIL